MQIITTANMDRGLAYGESCFETFRVIDGQIFDWPGHWQRLAAGLAEFDLMLAPGCDTEVLFACLREAAKTSPDSLLRLTISGGDAGWGLTKKAPEPITHIQCMPYHTSDAPLLLRLATWPFPLKKKTAKFTADYSETLRALHGAADAHVLFEQGGFILASATANVLLYRDGAWLTPMATAGVLPGRVRDFLILHKVVREVICPLNWLEDCEAAVVCNSGVFIQSIANIADVQRVQALQTEHAAIEVLHDILRQQEGVQL